MTSNPYNGFSASVREKVGRSVYGKFKTGEWPAPTTCEVCGESPPGKVQAHLENYNDPTSWHAICKRCHMALHKRFRDPAGWLGLLDRIDVGLAGADGHQVPGWVRALALTPVDLTGEGARQQQE